MLFKNNCQRLENKYFAIEKTNSSDKLKRNTLHWIINHLLQPKMLLQCLLVCKSLFEAPTFPEGVPHILDFFSTNWKRSRVSIRLNSGPFSCNIYAGQYCFAGRRGQHRHEGRWRLWRREKTPTTSWCSPPTGGATPLLGSKGEVGSRVQKSQASRGQSPGCKWRSGKSNQTFQALQNTMNFHQGVYKRVVGEDQLENGQLDPRLRISTKGN